MSMSPFERNVNVNCGDWTYGTCHFTGDKPSNSRSIGDINVWYNGEWESSSTTSGGVTHYYVTGDCCVAYPTNHIGEDIVMHSRKGSVQIQYYKR